MSETQEIEAAVMRLLADKTTPQEPAEVIENLAIKYEPWLVRQAIWSLTAKGAAELTWDRKLQLGPYSGREIAVAA